MQIINLLVLVFVRKFKVQRILRNCILCMCCVGVCVSIAMNESQSEMTTKTWNHIIWCQQFVCVEYVRNFSCNFKTQRKKVEKKPAENYATFNEWKKVFIFRIIAVLPLKLQIRVPEAFSWVEWKIKFAKNLCFASFSKNSKSNMSRMGAGNGF